MDDEGNEEPISIHERRRRAPMHFWALANNARFAAKVLWDAADADQKAAAASISYSDTPHVALHEAFSRECSIAMELVLKALISQRMELGQSKQPGTKPSATHDLVKLWASAEMPALPREDQHTLVIGKRVLQWSGRYAAPNKDEHYKQAVDEEDALREAMPGISIRIFRTRSISWDQFDRIYSAVATELWRVRDASGR